jgi:hypothetical protein
MNKIKNEYVFRGGKKDESKTKQKSQRIPSREFLYYSSPENLYFSLMNVVDGVFLEDLSIE